MPEGPSIIILKELLLPFKNRKVMAASGYAKIDIKNLLNKKITDIKSWGKHTLICFNGFTIRIHLMMFGSYRINEEKEKANPTLRLEFSKGERINFYTCAVKILEEPLDDI
ncbi:DNA-formamidopyrimidine glycosylase family protein [Flavipsychrobacter stenotrophus]|uniref:DNA-formamidopyrimidine glycosylase family protein n=1 Tax=Flavipsychrobacter stenotrophus TaxID=2077091 RepID=UPI001F0CDBA0|nr:DNA-formamidopyrimidine glycosylase family protein [Flavipsychrobacter stenotrophus]